MARYIIGPFCNVGIEKDLKKRAEMIKKLRESNESDL
jgi:hypothetical protein